MSFFSKILNSSSFGLDISDRSIKVIQFKQKNKKLSLFSYGTEEISSNSIIEDGEIKDFQKLAEVIKRAKNKAKPNPIETNHVICSLPESKCFFREVSLPKMTLKEVNEAIKWEVEQQVPLSREEIYLDWYILDKKDPLKKINKIFLTAAPRQLVDSYVKVLKQASLQPIAMEVESAATVRALIGKNKYNSVVLIIDLGETRTSFIIFKSPIIRFTRSISFSGSSLTNEISKGLKIEYQEAEKLKKEWGLDKEKGNGSLIKCLEPLLRDLSKNIRESLNYYSGHFNGNFSKNEVKKIILCGGGANLKGLDSWLASEIKKEVEKIDSWDNIAPKNPCYTTAIGLALRGMK